VRTARVRRLLVCCLLVGATLLPFGPRAVAADAPTPTVAVIMPSVSISPESRAVETDALVFGQGVFDNLTVKYDTGGVPAWLSMFLEQKHSPWACTEVGPLPQTTSITCTLHGSTDLATSGRAPNVTVIAGDGAQLGDVGRIRVTVTADNLPSAVSDEDTVTVAEGVNLVGTSEKLSTTPGGTATAVAGPQNKGTTTIHGVVLLSTLDQGLTVATKYRNCLYGDASMFVCTFDGDLRPGATYGITPGIGLRVDQRAASGNVESLITQWLTPQDWSDIRTYLTKRGIKLPDRPGSASPLALTAVPAPAAARSQAATPPQTNDLGTAVQSSHDVTVTGSNVADLAAIGATETAWLGAYVTIKVGVKNNGPATVFPTTTNPYVVVPSVVFPSTTTAVEVPANCWPPDQNGLPNTFPPGKVGLDTYLCQVDTAIEPGQTAWLTFKVYYQLPGFSPFPDQHGGQIALYDSSIPLRTSRSGDTQESNDVAAIVINNRADASGGAGSPGTGSGTAGGAGGGAVGGRLPVTGAPVGLIAGGGAVALVLGAGMVVLARRRRTAGPADS
jgi:hypothetical protein